jgi:L-arabinose isomerase
MPKGQQFSQDMKQIFFNVIKFVEKEKFGTAIPLFNVNERLSAMLNISLRSVERLKSEIRDIEHDMMENKRKMDEEKEALENQKVEVLSRLRNLRSRSSSSTINTSTMVIGHPIPRSPQKL